AGSGLWLTNARFLIGADESKLRVRSYNNREYPASIVGYDLPSGVGVLKADVPAVPSIQVAQTVPALSESSWAVCFPVVFEDDVVRYLPVSLHQGHLTATVQVGGDKIVTVWDAGRRLLAAPPGGAGVTLTVARGSAETRVPVTPVKRPERVMLDPIDELQETLEANLKEVTTGPGAQQGLVVTNMVRGGRGEKG